MQPYFCTSQSSLFKPNTSRVKFAKPNFAPNALHIEHKVVPRLQQRSFVSLGVPTVLLILSKSIEINVFFSTKITRTDVKSVQQPSIK